MKLLILPSILIAINLISAELNILNQESNQRNSQLSSNGVAVDEVVVESSLFIKPKQQRPLLRRVRRSILSKYNTLKSLAEHKRVKRQNDEYGNSAANAQSQAFDIHGPTGAFGASHDLPFNLPNGQSVNFASTHSFANGKDDNNANSLGSAASVNRI